MRTASAPRRGLRRLGAVTAATALIATTLVVATTENAVAAGIAPGVSVSVPDSYIAGEDLTLDIAFISAPEAGAQYNLSAGVVLSEDVHVVDSGTLGTPRIYAAGTVLRGAIAGGTQPSTCAELGLTNAASPAGACQVPAGKQYLVFQNISDLPPDASTNHQLTLRPDAGVFPVGSDFPYQINAYTNGNERFLPVFPGSTGVNTPAAREGTSSAGIDEASVLVNALRIEKREPSPESELLRGVHDNTTTYTLRVYHTGEGDIDGVTVVDYLPAGLEYLGQGGRDIDNTTNANGNRSVADEYEGSGGLTGTPRADGDHRAWDGTGETVETIIPTSDEVERYGLEAGAVYTRVTWNLGQLLASGDDRDMERGLAQNFSAEAGEAGWLEIHYRAGVPLFENTMDFDGSGGQPGIDGQQTANLDNNRGPSTRHGLDAPQHDAQSLTNHAVARGTHDGATVEDDTTHTVDAIDVRVIKSVDTGTFEQGEVVRYTLDLATSEYVSATMSGDRPFRLVDDLGDGLCPVFPAGTPVAPGASTHGDDVPNLIIGNPHFPGDGYERDLSIAEWNGRLVSEGASSACGYPSSAATAPDQELSGATLTGIAFDPVSGLFFLDFGLESDALDQANARHAIGYSALQNENYRGSGPGGATSSGDRIRNTVEILAETHAVDAVRDLENAGGHGAGNDERAWDDSDVEMRGELAEISKHVLQRDAAVSDPADIADVAEAQWVKKADDAFAVGDAVWYRIQVTPPSGTDVRNPRLTDFLPLGVEFDATDADDNGRPDDLWIEPSSTRGLGSCEPPDDVKWLNTFVPFDQSNVDGNVLTFNLGSSDCHANSDDRFLPLDTTLSIYIKVTVTDVTAFGEVDLSENLAKYQQNNVHGDIFFLRDAAEIEMDRSPRLLKGIRENSNEEGTSGNAFDSDVDGEQVVQQDDVTFRLDVTAPLTTTNDYVVYDLLPPGIKAADVEAGSFTAATVVKGSPSVETPLAGGDFDATVVDYGDTDYPTNIKNADTHQRSVIVWAVAADIPASTKAVVDENGTETAPAVTRGLTLGYTVTIPEGTVADGGAAALIGQRYVNDASIVRFDAANNTGGDSTTFVDGSDNVAEAPSADDLSDGQFLFADENNDTSDPSNVFLPNVEMDKILFQTEIGPNDAPNPPGGANDLDPNNADGAIVQGEYATFDYSVTIPANTTVREGVLFDLGDFAGQGSGTISPSNSFPYKVAGAELPTDANPTGITVNEVEDSDPAVHATEFGFRTDTGLLVFPEYYSTGDADETFTVRLTVWTNDVDATNPSTGADRPSIPNNKTLRNTAVFDSKNVGDTAHTRQGSDSADVQYREPNLAIQKAATSSGGDIDDVDANDVLTYTLTVTNSNRVKSYDNVVVDTVPAGLIVDLDSFAVGGIPVDRYDLTIVGEIGTGEGGTITWTYSDDESSLLNGLAEIPASAVLTYNATIDPSTGAGLQYENTATVTGYTLPESLGSDAEDRRGDRRSTDDVTITATTAEIAKNVRLAETEDAFANSVSAPIGDTVEYQVDITLKAGINYYDPRIVDDLPAGVVLIESSIAGPAVVEGSPAPTGTWTRAYDTATNVHTWTFDGDIESASVDRTLRVTYQVDLTNSVASTVNALPNTAQFSWNKVDDDEDTRTPIDDPANVTVLNPVLDIVKKVDGEDSIERNPDATFDYTLTVTNTGNTPAYNVTIVDQVPEGVVVDESSISTVQGVDGVLAGHDPVTGGGTITWADIPGPLDVYTDGEDDAERIELGYEGSFAPSSNLAAEDFPYENIADVTSYESFDEGGRVYVPGQNGVPPAQDEADVTPLFPHVVPEKSVTSPVEGEDYGVALVGQPFGWTLTIVNEGDGVAREISVTDTLPENWEYVPGSATLDGAALGDPAIDTAAGTLTWSAAQLESVLPLAAGGSFAIAFDAIPTADARDDSPGTGILVNPHTNTVSVTATDTTGADENGDGDYTGDDSTADAYIAEADLKLVKEAIGGVIEHDRADSRLRALDEGTWVPGQGAVTGEYAQPQWRITVTNHGPDAGEGPFEFVDTETLPDGVTTGSWSARYYSSASDTTGTGLLVTPTPDGFVVGDGTVSLNADGTDRIVVTADVTIAPGATATAEELANVASVEGATYEREDHKTPPHENPNTDDAAKPLTPVADLAIQKSFTGAPPRNAGDPISWTLQVTNNGPSDSISSAGDGNQIVVTDDVPEQIENVALLEGSTLPAGWELDLDGNSIVLTLTPEASFANGATASFTFSGNLKASVEAGTDIVNSATVTPGETPDPYDPNNEDEDSTDPITSLTTIGANKYRVERQGDQWVPVGEAIDVTPGTEITYRLGVVNTGTADARGVTITDALPDYLTLTDWDPESPAAGWSITEDDNELTFANSQNLAPGATASVVVTVTVNEGHTGDVVNTACVEADNATNDDCETDTTGSGKLVDWELEKSHTVPADGDAVNAGESVRYRLQVHNNGPSASAGPITVTDTLPAEFAYTGNVSATVQGSPVTLGNPSIQTDDDGRQVVTWTVTGPIRTGADVVTIEFDASVADDAAPGVYTNDARVDGVECEPGSETCLPEPGDDPSNNADDDEVPVVRSTTMTVEKQVLDAGDWAETAEIVAGTEVTWRVTIANQGPSAAPVTFTDQLPAGLTMTAMSGAGWDCDVAAVSCEYTANGGLHPVGAENATVIEFTSLVAANVPPTEGGDALVNWGRIAWVDNTTEDPTDEDDANVTVTREADLGVVKTALDAPDGEETGTAIAGESLWYRLVVTNHGPSDAVAPIVVNDELPEGISFVGLTGESAASWRASMDPDDSQSVTFVRTPEAGIVADGSAPEIVVEVMVDPAVASGAELTNVVEISDETLDPNNDTNPDNNRDDATVTVERRIDLGIDKSHDADQVRVGGELPFGVAVTNHGPSEATGITVTDTVPAGLEVVSVPGDGVGEGWVLESVALADAENPAGGATVVATYAEPLAPGETAPLLTLITKVTAAAYDTVTNVVDVEGNEPEPDPDTENPNRDEDPVVVPPLVTLVVEKTAVGEFAVGETGTFEIEVSNTGPTDDPGPITVTDALPRGLTFESSRDENVSAEGDVVTWILPDGLKVGESVTLTLTVNVLDAAYPEVTNTVVIDTPSTTTPESTLTDDETVEVAEADTQGEGMESTGIGIDAGLLWAILALLALGGGAMAVARRRQARNPETP